MSKICRGSYGHSIWKTICMVSDAFKEHFSFEINDGKSVRFWWDIWCGQSPLAMDFPICMSWQPARMDWLVIMCVIRA